MANRKAAYGAPAEEKEIVVTMDKRVLYGAGVLVLVLALVGGVLFARQNAGAPQIADAPASGGAPQPAQPPVGGVPQISDADARATAAALGLPTSVSIVQSVIENRNTSTPNPFAEQLAQVTPAAGNQ